MNCVEAGRLGGQATGPSKARNLRGEQIGTSKLTERQVLKLLALAAEGYSTSVLAERYRISRDHVSQIIRGRSWAHLSRGGQHR